MKQVQISYELFRMLLLYHMGIDHECEEQIKKELEKKLDTMVNRELYTQYKTTPSKEERDRARKEYLDRKGILDGFRW